KFRKMKSFKTILVLTALVVLSVATTIPATPADMAEPEATTASDNIVIQSGCLCNPGARGRPFFSPSCCN
ncbi:hypothetical protein BGZ92_002503, partial [Podila epicladia]